MANIFNISGATTVTYDTSSTAGSSFSGTALGQTDSNDLISFELEYFKEPIHTTEFGPHIPAQYVNLGALGYLSMTLVKWDLDALEDLTQMLPGTIVESSIGDIGALMLGADTAVGVADQTYSTDGQCAIKLVTSIGSDYTFRNCVIDGRIRVMDFGNRPQRLALNFLCLPYAESDNTLEDGSVIYTES